MRSRGANISRPRGVPSPPSLTRHRSALRARRAVRWRLPPRVSVLIRKHSLRAGGPRSGGTGRHPPTVLLSERLRDAGDGALGLRRRVGAAAWALAAFYRIRGAIPRRCSWRCGGRSLDARAYRTFLGGLTTSPCAICSPPWLRFSLRPVRGSDFAGSGPVGREPPSR